MQSDQLQVGLVRIRLIISEPTLPVATWNTRSLASPTTPTTFRVFGASEVGHTGTRTPGRLTPPVRCTLPSNLHYGPNAIPVTDVPVDPCRGRGSGPEDRGRRKATRIGVATPLPLPRAWSTSGTVTVQPSRLGGAVLCGIAVLGTACGGATRSARPPTTTRPPTATDLHQVVAAGRLTFAVPSSWTVGHGTCRCGWGTPGTATLDNGTRTPGVMCSCPMESGNAASGLHLYEGHGGLDPGGTPTVINGVRALVALDPSTATLTATFPLVDQWITVAPGPQSTSGPVIARQVALERRILATVTVVPGGQARS